MSVVDAKQKQVLVEVSKIWEIGWNRGMPSFTKANRITQQSEPNCTILQLKY